MKRFTGIALSIAVFALSGHAAEIQIRRTSNNLLEISGGTGDHTWHILYGSERFMQALPLHGLGDTAYFTHGVWLRRVDVRAGLVTGRWRMPGDAIVGLKWRGELIEVQVEQRVQAQERLQRAILFNPAAPAIPSWQWSASLLSSPEPYRVPNLALRLRTGNVKGEDARKLIPETENAVRRDPAAPLLRVVLGQLHRAAGTGDGRIQFEEAARTTPVDFVDMFRVSTTLESIGEREIARIAFERGCEDYWRRGYDPRLVLGARSSGFVANLLLQQLAPVNAPVESLDIFDTVFTVVAAANAFGLSTAAAAAIYAGFLFLRNRHEKPERYFNFEYWSLRQRIAFCGIIAAAWLACGFAGTAWRAMVRTSAIQALMRSGTFAGPVGISILESVAVTPARNLILAIAYHHDGQLHKAAELYRTVPQFAESWNNLGAILLDSGKAAEATQAFARAIEIDPTLIEARQNLGSAPPDPWAELHRKYRQERAMHAIPRREHFMETAFGGSIIDVLLQSLRGVPALGGRELEGRLFVPPLFLIGASGIFILALLALPLLLAPLRDPASSATYPQHLIEALIPGIHPRWSYAGGVVLVAWTFCLTWILVVTGYVQNSRLFFTPAIARQPIWPAVLMVVILWISSLILSGIRVNRP